MRIVQESKLQQNVEEGEDRQAGLPPLWFFWYLGGIGGIGVLLVGFSRFLVFQVGFLSFFLVYSIMLPIANPKK